MLRVNGTSGYNTDLLSGKITEKDKQSHLERVNKWIKEAKTSGFKVNLKGSAQLPWEKDDPAGLYNSQSEILKSKINYCRKMLGMEKINTGLVNIWKLREGYLDVPAKKKSPYSRQLNSLFSKSFSDDAVINSNIKLGLITAYCNKLVDLETELHIENKELKFKTDLIRWVNGNAPYAEYAYCPWANDALKKLSREAKEGSISALRRPQSWLFEENGANSPQIDNRDGIKWYSADEITKNGGEDKNLSLARISMEKLKKTHPEVLDGVFSIPDEIQIKTEAFLGRLQNTFPKTQEEAYLYYKYIIKKRPINVTDILKRKLENKNPLIRVRRGDDCEEEEKIRIVKNEKEAFQVNEYMNSPCDSDEEEYNRAKALRELEDIEADEEDGLDKLFQTGNESDNKNIEERLAALRKNE